VKNKRYSVILTSLSLLLLTVGCSEKHTEKLSPQDHDSLQVQELVKTTRSWDGAGLPEYPEGQPEITILHISIPAGTRLETHSHPVINAGVLTKGEIPLWK